MHLLAISRYPHGHRVHLLGARLHHGMFGLVLAVVGIALAYHDRQDLPWLTDY